MSAYTRARIKNILFLVLAFTLRSVETEQSVSTTQALFFVQIALATRVFSGQSLVASKPRVLMPVHMLMWAFVFTSLKLLMLALALVLSSLSLSREFRRPSRRQ